MGDWQEFGVISQGMLNGGDYARLNATIPEPSSHSARTMPHPLSANQVRRLRLHAQRLAPGPETTPDIAAVVRWVVGLQAQDARAAALSARARFPGITADAVARALTQTRSLVRTWLMRGTLHLAAADDLHWLLAALAPRFKKTSRRRREQLGLDDETAARGAQTLEEVLRRRGPLTRAQIRAAPALKDVPLDGQAAPHLIGYAALDGRVCHGPARDGNPTYAPLADWIDLPAAPSEHEALAMLTRRYLKAYGPAGPRDMARWSGLTLRVVRKGFERINHELTEVAVGGEPAWVLAEETPPLDEPPRHPVLHLLPKYDTLLMGYQRRDWILPAKHAKRIYPGGGLLRRSVLAVGRIVGTWDPKREGNDILRVVVDLFEDLPPPVCDALAAEAEDVGRFSGKRGVLEIA